MPRAKCWLSSSSPSFLSNWLSLANLSARSHIFTRLPRASRASSHTTIPDSRVVTGGRLSPSCSRGLDDQGLVSLLGQDVVDGLPAGTIDERAMHEHDR